MIGLTSPIQRLYSGTIERDIEINICIIVSDLVIMMYFGYEIYRGAVV